MIEEFNVTPKLSVISFI